ncbi:cuticle protein 19.8-like [Pollicipes pollicipes]|uniref:cuticle protein 19.8-like n=1 Tax=Pollicipes pollicipes TaxID=41117 RepID=UPI001884A981|nr:cuticle protein 19.8-like [Pollicipes pollicipes]
MKVLVISALLAVAAADSGPSYQAPAAGYKGPAPAYHQPSYDTPPKYNYNYDVHGYGDYAPQFNAQENRDGYKTQGSYTVALPDGRTQTVTYRVDDAYSGFVADVKYQGEAKYPAYQPQPAYQPAPAYKPPSYKPAYKPAPSYS